MLNEIKYLIKYLHKKSTLQVADLNVCCFSKLPASQRHHYEVIPEGLA